MHRNTLAVGAVFALGTAAQAQTFIQSDRFMTDDLVSNEQFGSAIDIQGDVVAIGRQRDSGQVFYTGSVYLFDLETSELLHTLRPDDPVEQMFFGATVAMSDDHIIVGAPFENNSVGSVFVFDRATLEQQFKILPPNPVGFTRFGNSIAIHDDRLLIGAPYAQSGTGAAYLYDPNTGQLISELQSPTPQSGAQFGNSVALDANRAVVAQSAADVGEQPSAGAVQIFDTRTGSFEQTITKPFPARYESFGGAVALDGDFLLASSGEPRPEAGPFAAGVAHLIDLNTGEFVQRYASPDPSSPSAGATVAIDSDTVLIGAPFFLDGPIVSSAYAFDRTTGQQIAKFVESQQAPYTEFGATLDLQDGVAVIGARLSDGYTGSAFRFDIPSAQCAPDLDNSGSVNIDDLNDFLDRVIDYNNDGNFDFFDIQDFITQLNQGCP